MSDSMNPNPAEQGPTEVGSIGTAEDLALDRLKMCSDCRVVDMMKKEL